MGLDNRLIPPRPAIDEVLHSLHQSHMSPQTLIQNEELLYYWPGMAHDIKKKAESCESCRLYKKSNSKTKGVVPLELEEFLPGEAWSVDVLSFRGVDYLVAVCIVTSFAWVAKLRRKGAKDLAAALRHFVCQWGAPRLLKSDGATRFTAQAFESFCEDFGIHHVLTSAYNAPSNGSAERMVQEVKQLMKKGEHRDPDLLMKILNSTARPRNRGTPLNLMLGRASNGYLPNQINEDLKLLENYRIRQKEADEYAKA